MIDKKNIVRSLITLTDRQKDSLDLFARNICRKRTQNICNEKITTSAIIRCLVENFMDDWDKFDIEEINNEDELLKRVKDYSLSSLISDKN